MSEIVKLGDVLSTGAGGTPLKSQKKYYEGGDIKWLLSGAVCEKDIHDSKTHITEEGLTNSSAKLFPSNTVLVAMYGATAGQVGILRTEAATNQAVCGIYPSKNYLPEFLYYYLTNYKETLLLEVSGVAQPNLSQVKIKNIPLPLISLAEQRRIVAKLDAAFAEIDKIATNTQQKLEEVQKLYASGITEIYFSNKSVHVVPLSTVSKIKGGKRLPKGSKLQPEPTNHPYIRVSDFTDFGTIDEKSIQYITEEIHSEISRYTISSNDVYVSIAGTIGKTGIIPQSLDGANLTENAAKIVLNEECDKDYFYFFTTSSSFEKQAIAQTRTAAQPKLALERLGAVELPIHNKLSQQAIAEKARSVRDKVRLVETLLNEKLVQTQVLKSAILAQELQSEAA